jgi:hypothetical protein
MSAPASIGDEITRYETATMFQEETLAGWSLYFRLVPKDYGTLGFLVTDTLIETNNSDIAIIRVISFKKGYSRNIGASPNPKNAPTNAPTQPTTILVGLNILSNLSTPGSIPTAIPVASTKIASIVPKPYQIKIDS